MISTKLIPGENPARTTEEIRANAQARVYDVDWSPKKPEKEPKHWQEGYKQGLRSGKNYFAPKAKHWQEG
jgi:hypothetical protein